MSVVDQISFGTEASGYAVSTAASRGFELVDEGVEGDYGRIESKSITPGGRFLSEDRFATDLLGGAGPVKLEWQSKGMAMFLKPMLGAVAQSGPTDGAYTYTGTVADLLGSSLVYQKGLKLVEGAVQPYTYDGCKIGSWELGNEVGGLLEFGMDLDAARETGPVGATGNYALQVPTYRRGELFHYAGGVITIAGTQVGLPSKISIKGDNKIKTDRRGIRGTALKKEPVEIDEREYMVELGTEFDTTAHHARYAAAVASGAVVSFTAVWTAPTLIGATTYPSLTVTIPKLRLDGGSPKSGGFDINEQPIRGKVLAPTGGGSPITITYVTSDSTA